MNLKWLRLKAIEARELRSRTEWQEEGILVKEKVSPGKPAAVRSGSKIDRCKAL